MFSSLIRFIRPPPPRQKRANFSRHISRFRRYFPVPVQPCYFKKVCFFGKPKKKKKKCTHSFRIDVTTRATDGGDLYDDAYRLTRVTVPGQISGVRQQSLWRCYSVTCTRATDRTRESFAGRVFSFLIGFTVAAECSFATNAST